ncbi:MAG: DUF4249 family protein [Bacteroidota bacterium]
MKMMIQYISPKQLSWLTALVLMAGACTERIEIDLDETYTRLVVDGQINSDDTARQMVLLSKSSSYFYNQPPPPVSNASVQIIDDMGNVSILSEEEPGEYLLPEGFSSEIGRTYTLDIHLQEELNEKDHYTATSFTPNINDTAYIDLLFHDEWGEKGYYVVRCYYWDPPEANFYMFNIYKNDTLITDSLSKKMIVDDRFYNGGFTNGIGVGFLDQSKQSEIVRPGDVITFQAASITEGYAYFIWEVQEEISFSTPLFSGPPANVTGNISGGAIGYFTSYPVVYAETIAE